MKQSDKYTNKVQSEHLYKLGIRVFSDKCHRRDILYDRKSVKEEKRLDYNAYGAAELGWILSKHGDWSAGFNGEDYYCTVNIRMENGILLTQNTVTTETLIEAMYVNVAFLITKKYLNPRDINP